MQRRILVGRELKYRNVWLIALRYVAGVGMLLAALLLPAVRGTPVAWPVVAMAVLVLGYNAILHVLVERVRFADWYTAGYRLAAAQVVLDLASLTWIIHECGGVQTPLVFFYVFHGIIAAILLSRRAAYLQAALAMAFLSLVAVLEHTEVLARKPPLWAHATVRATWSGVTAGDFGDALAVLVTVGMTLFVSVFMTLSLSRELRTREEELRRANAKLREQDQLRADYVRLITHDLKSPLAAIQSSLRVALDGYVGELNERQRDVVGRAENRAAQLSRLISGMLELSRVRSHQDLERSEWSLVEMIRGVEETLRPLAGGNRQTTFLDLPETKLTVRANRDLLEQVFLNLIGNAVKYTSKEGSVFVRVWRGESELVAEVGDTGIGIPPESLDRVFDEFYRASNAKKLTRDGTGLGLALVRQIVVAHGGAIRVESPWPVPDGGQPRGTRFELRLPWSRIAPSSPPQDGLDAAA